MDFYYVNYFFEQKTVDENWIKIRCLPEQIIVIASDLTEAQRKIDKCLDVYNKSKKDNQRYRITGNIIKMDGLHMFRDFNGSISCYPIHEKEKNERIEVL